MDKIHHVIYINFLRPDKAFFVKRLVQAVRLELFQKAFIQALFGFIDPQTGCRQYRESFFLVGRKNGKSTLLAGLALYMLTSDGEGGAEVYSTATKYAQARLLFDEAHNMIKQSPVLSKHFRKRKKRLVL